MIAFRGGVGRAWGASDATSILIICLILLGFGLIIGIAALYLHYIRRTDAALALGSLTLVMVLIAIAVMGR